MQTAIRGRRWRRGCTTDCSEILTELRDHHPFSCPQMFVEPLLGGALLWGRAKQHPPTRALKSSPANGQGQEAGARGRCPWSKRVRGFHSRGWGAARRKEGVVRGSVTGREKGHGTWPRPSAPQKRAGGKHRALVGVRESGRAWVLQESPRS